MFCKNISQTFSNNLEIASVQNRCREISVMDYFFKKLHGLRQDLQLSKKNHPKVIYL